MAESYDNMQGQEQDVSDHQEMVHPDPIAEANSGFAEKLARAISGGRDRGQRALYNTTRAGMLNPNTVPDEAGPYGGLLPSLKERRSDDMNSAELVSQKFRK